ncbi:hypothetical protein [Streptomyces albus]|uniref:hypothetical protein n=1 Tax=Streptomyces albus TaxID=1888 RepID=UPI003F19EF02
MFDRFAIDDGRHSPDLVIEEDATHAAGTARYRVGCSCGRMPQQTADSGRQALAMHIAHVRAKVGPSRGPAWLPVGARVVLLAAAMLATYGACYATGQALINGQDIAGATATLVLAGFHLAGLGCGFGLMVATRRYIAPTRD